MIVTRFSKEELDELAKIPEGDGLEQISTHWISAPIGGSDRCRVFDDHFQLYGCDTEIQRHYRWEGRYPQEEILTCEGACYMRHGEYLLAVVNNGTGGPGFECDEVRKWLEATCPSNVPCDEPKTEEK